MQKRKITISGAGCALADYLFTNVSFHSKAFQKYQSKAPGDGGLSPGKLVFAEELQKFGGIHYSKILNEITKGLPAYSFNIGGPSIVSLIHVAQMLNSDDFDVKFFGISGNDDTSDRIRNLLKKTPLDFLGYLATSKQETPFTQVLSDPDYHSGQGERTFINNIGAAWDLTPDFLPEAFFESDIVCFGGTALTPNLHDNLQFLLQKAKSKGALTLVNTVYDFRNEKQNPGKPWPLGKTEQSLQNTDVLILDYEEALKISGGSTISQAADFFSEKTSAFIITQGAEPVHFFSNGNVFEKASGSLNVSTEVAEKIKYKVYRGDTTGCGDNFVGGVITSIAEQLQKNRSKLNLEEAVIFGICSGGFACSYHGGTWFENSPNEKRNEIEQLISSYHPE